MVERRKQQGVNFFNGLRPSRQALGLVNQALRLGIDPSTQTRKAAAAATNEGRRKVGGFGGGKEPLNALQEQIRKAQWSQTLRNPGQQI